jgi:putative ABC transport system substrate-binding protein
MTDVRDQKSAVSKALAPHPLLVSLSFLIAILLVVNFTVEAQQAKKIPRVGILFIGSRNQPHLEAFKQGLRERGYIEDKDIVLEYRYAEGNNHRLRELAAELVRDKVDIIVTTASVSALAARAR